MSENDGLPDWIVQHLEQYAADPQAAHDWDATAPGGKPNTPVLLLSTTGAKSGLQRTLPLIYGRHGDSYVVIASKGGAPAHPAWYLNLVANPDCKIQVIEQHMNVKARTAQGEERAALWDALVDIYPPYTHYQQETDREIPVVVLDPV